MTTAPTALTVAEFIERRLAEDEAAAREHLSYRSDMCICVDTGAGYEGLGWVSDYDPARVLAQVEALRAVVEEYQRAEARAEFPDYDGGYAAGLEDALRALASIWRGHEQWREEWSA